jgi:Kef-type K+ transport system membrane component KefB
MRRTLAALAIAGGLIVLRGGALAAPAAAVPVDPATAAAATAAPEEAEESHGGPVVPVLLGLVLILAAAKLGGELFERFGQPAVLGELVFGVVLGNLALLGIDDFEFLGTNGGLEVIAQLGVILLLFEVGLESDTREMLAVGWSSLLVACLGVVAPFFLGWGVAAWFLPEEHYLAHVFIGATLCATSVGITARVLADLGKVATREARIVLGAAVIDDVLGLVILAVVAGVIAAADTGGALAWLDVALIVLKAIAFLGGALLAGSWAAPRLFRLASRLKIRGMLLTVALVVCFLLSWVADLIGLAPIVGAFAAGLILDEVQYRDFRERGEHKLEELLRPITTFLVPVFFVLMGVRVDLASFGRVEVLGFAALLTAAAIAGKMLCAAGVLERGLDRLSVAVGMVPRGEVGLIFAGFGAQLMLGGERVIVPAVYAAIVIMVIVTTLITPPALKLTLARGERKRSLAATLPREQRGRAGEGVSKSMQ